MSVANPAFRIPRESVVESEGLFTKMFDPPRLGPPTPELLDLTQIGLSGNPTNPLIPAGVRANPVPSVLQAAGMMNPTVPYTMKISLMHGVTLPTWDGGVNTGSGAKELAWFLFQHDQLLGTINEFQTGKVQGASAPIYPAPCVRVPRGAVYHSDTSCQGPPPHTIHWHGIEPTPMNDGVGHCSFEVEGSYIYQWQPNFIGTYFYHCHRNTVQHFEFGLAGLMLFDTPDAYFASIATVVDPSKGTVTLNDIPIGHGRPEKGFPLGRRRTAAFLPPYWFPADQFPGWVGGNPFQGVATPDSWGGDPFYKFKYDPRAFTVPYDVEALWVPDDRSSQWGNPAGRPPSTDPFATFPVGGTVPGINDLFHQNGGKGSSPLDFFSFNDYNADYWFISGIRVPVVKGGTAAIPAGIVLPAVWNGGIAGAQVSIQAGVGQTVFIRMLNAAYNSLRITMPVDIVIIEWDGRALGVPPLNRYTRPQVVKAGTPITTSTARRWGAIFRSLTPINSFAKVEFLDTRSAKISLTGGGDLLATAQIPITIS